MLNKEYQELLANFCDRYDARARQSDLRWSRPVRTQWSDWNITAGETYESWNRTAVETIECVEITVPEDRVVTLLDLDGKVKFLEEHMDEYIELLKQMSQDKKARSAHPEVAEAYQHYEKLLEQYKIIDILKR